MLYSLRNCPNLHVAYGYNHPTNEMSNRHIEKRFEQVLLEFRPEIIHFQDLLAYVPSDEPNSTWEFEYLP